MEVQLAYPFERDGERIEPDTVIELPDEEATLMIREGRARVPDSVTGLDLAGVKRADAVGTEGAQAPAGGAGGASSPATDSDAIELAALRAENAALRAAQSQAAGAGTPGGTEGPAGGAEGAAAVSGPAPAASAVGGVS